MSLELALAMLRLAPLSGFMRFQNWRMAPRSRSQRLPQAQNVVGAGFSFSHALWFYGISKLTDGPLSRSQRLPQAQNVVGTGFSHAAAGPLSGFMGFQNWRMAPCPDLKGFPRPKMSLELALAMLRLGPWLILWCFKLTDGPLSRSQRLPQAQNAVGTGFSHAAAGPPLWFYEISKCADPKGFPRPKMSLELALAMLRLAPWLVLWGFKTDARLAPSLVLWDFKTDGWPPAPISKASPGPKCRWSWL